MQVATLALLKNKSRFIFSIVTICDFCFVFEAFDIPYIITQSANKIHSLS